MPGEGNKVARAASHPQRVSPLSYQRTSDAQRHVNRAAPVTLASSITTVGAATVERMFGASLANCFFDFLRLPQMPPLVRQQQVETRKQVIFYFTAKR